MRIFQQGCVMILYVIGFILVCLGAIAQDDL